MQNRGSSEDPTRLSGLCQNMDCINFSYFKWTEVIFWSTWHWTQTFKNLFKKQTNKTSVKNLRMTGGSSFPFDK